MSYKRLISGVISFVAFVSVTSHAQQFYNVVSFGAKNDSSQLVTESVRKAIEAASKAGGGTVYFPAGKYLTGPIHLKSNITIFIDAGAILHFSDNFDDYLPMVPSRWEGTDVVNFSPLFYAYKAENITITGRGVIDGHGKKWWDFHHKLYDKSMSRTKWQEEFAKNNLQVIKPDEPFMIDRGFLRPPFIQPMYCKNVLIEGITIRNSPFWTVNPEFCENVTIHNLTIVNPKSPNTDGINPESCKYVHISNCHISVGDDCITIKSGKDRAGRAMAMPAENYTITNCTMLSGHGGVVIGSEMSGGVKKITISNCIFDGTDRGIRIKTVRGRGGVVEDIRVDNIIMKNIRDQAIVLDMHYARTQAEPVSERTPQFKNIHFSNITAQTNEAVFLNGLAEMPIDDITFHDILFDAQKGITVKEARNIAFHNVRITTKEGASLLIESSKYIDVENIKTLNPLPGVPLISLINSEAVNIYNCFPHQLTDVFLQLKGTQTKSIIMRSNNLNNVKKPVDKSIEVTGSILTDQ
jgi:polygalacturonase